MTFPDGFREGIIEKDFMNRLKSNFKVQMKLRVRCYFKAEKGKKIIFFTGEKEFSKGNI